MKSKRIFFGAGLFLLAHGVSLAAPPDEVAVSAKKRLATPALSAAAGHPSAASAAEKGADGLPSAQVVFQVLLAEIALQRGEVALASSAYADLALRTHDPKILERTVEVSGYARRFDLAQEAARLWLEVEPDSLQAQRLLASVMVAANQTDDLAPFLVKLLREDRESLAENLLGLNRMLARNLDQQTILRVVEKVAQAFPEEAEAHYALALAAASAEQNEKALGEVRRALELRPQWDMAAVLQAQIVARRSSGEAVDYLQSYVGHHAQARDARLYLARLLVGEKRYDDAQQHFRLLLQDYPDNPDIVFPVAILALQQNDRALAEAQLKHLLTLTVPDKSFAHYYLGQLAEDAARVDEALERYAQVGAGEYYLRAQLRRAHLLIGQGRVDEARRQLGAAKYASADEAVQLAIAEAGLLREAGQPQAAYDLLDGLLDKQPEQPDLLYETALLAEKLGHTDVLERRLRKLIELRPENAQAYNALGYFYAQRNERLDEARALVEKALKLSPDDYFILDSMGWVLFRQNDLPAALIYLERAYALREDPEVAAHLGEVLWVLGRRDEAGRTLREAEKKFPGNETLLDAVKKFAP